MVRTLVRGMVGAALLGALMVLAAPEAAQAQARCAQIPSSVATALLRSTNEERTKAGLPTVRLDSRLSQAAHVHACDMRTARFFSHTSPTTGSVGARVKRTGYTWCTVAENIARGQTTSAQAMRGWMASRGHRRNILSPAFSDVGFGYVEGGQGPYWVQVFAAPCR